MAEAAHQQQGMIQTVETVYARALLELAKDAGVLDDIADQMADIAQLAGEQPDFIRLISTRTISADQRAGIIENMLKGRVHDLLYRFFQVVNRKHRLDHLQGIAAALAQLVDEDRGIVRVEAHVAQELPAQLAEQVADRIGKILDAKVVLTQHVQAELIGGLKLKIADRVIDGSVAAQLRNMERKINTTGRASAQAQAAALVPA